VIPTNNTIKGGTIFPDTLYILVDLYDAGSYYTNRSNITKNVR